MSPHQHNTLQQLELLGHPPLSYLAAAGVALPAGALVWFELVYLWFGLTGEDLVPALNIVSAMVSFGVAFFWPLYRARRPAEVVRRGCRLGIVAALLLPAVAIAVLLLWESAEGRRDLGMGGLMLYSIPLVSIAAAVVLGVLFAAGSHFAMRRMSEP